MVTIEKAYNHCAKAFVRSKLWGDDMRRPDGIPTIGDFAAYNAGADEAFAAKFDAEYEKGIPEALY